ERVLRVIARRGVLDGFGDREAEAARALWILGERSAARVSVWARARDDLRAPCLHEDPPVGLLVIRDADHVDLALEVEHSRGERKGAPPLTCASLGREALGPFLLVVVRLRDRGVRFVAARRADAFPFVVDARRGAEHLLEAERADERRRSPEFVGVTDGLGDLDPALPAHLLLDQLDRKERGKVRRTYRLPRARMQRRRERRWQVGLDVVPMRRKVLLIELKFALRRGSPCNGDGHGRIPPCRRESENRQSLLSEGNRQPQSRPEQSRPMLSGSGTR